MMKDKHLWNFDSIPTEEDEKQSEKYGTINDSMVSHNMRSNSMETVKTTISLTNSDPDRQRNKSTHDPRVGLGNEEFQTYHKRDGTSTFDNI